MIDFESEGPGAMHTEDVFFEFCEAESFE